MMVKERARLGAVYRRNLGAGLAHVALIFTAGRVFRWGSGLGLDISPSFLVAHPPQAAFLPGELGLSNPGPLSPSGVKSGSQYYPSYPSNPRRRAADVGLGELELGTCMCKGQCDRLTPGLGAAEPWWLQRASQWVL